MKTIYTQGLPAYHEADEMQFKYAIYDGEKLVDSLELYNDYKKPVLTGLYSIILLLKEVKQYRKEGIEIVVNDGALIEQINQTTTTRNRDVLKVADLCRKHLEKFGDNVTITSVAGNHEAKVNWEKKLDI